MNPSSQYLPSAFFLVLSPVLFYSPVSAAWSSKLPSSIRALKGSCVVIPCSFTYPGSRGSSASKFHVVWYQYQRHTYPEIYNSKSSASVLSEYKGRTEVVGDPGMGNCTLRINPVRSGDTMWYYVWINPDTVKHRFYDVTVKVEVTSKPEKLELRDPGLLTEGHPTVLSCSILHTCPLSPPTLAWNLMGSKAVTFHEQLAGGTWRALSSLNYTASHRDHGKPLRCTATFSNQQQVHSGIFLMVKHSPKNATVSVVGNRPLREGDNISLQCSIESNPSAVRYHWFHGSQKVPLPGAGAGSQVKVTDVQRDSGPYHCVAENDLGMGEESPPAYINVEYQPEFLPQGNCTLSRTRETVTCYCLAEGNPLPGIEWHLPNHTVPGDFNSTELQATLVFQGQTIIGVLRGPASVLTNVSCIAANKHGPSQIILSTIQADNSYLWLVAIGGVVGGLFLITLLGIAIYKVRKSRKQEVGQVVAEEAGDPSVCVRDGNGKWKVPPEEGSASKEELINMYSPTDTKDQNTEDYENMESAAQDYENVPAGGGAVVTQSNWQPSSGADQTYCNV